MTQMSKIQQVNSAIMFGEFSNTELDSIISAVQFAKGDTVKFHSTKRGMTMSGTVSKIAIKYVTVSTQQGLWKVPANMLEAA